MYGRVTYPGPGLLKQSFIYLRYEDNVFLGRFVGLSHHMLSKVFILSGQPLWLITLTMTSSLLRPFI